MEAGNIKDKNIYLTGCCLIPVEKKEERSCRLFFALDILICTVLSAFFCIGIMGLFLNAYGCVIDHARLYIVSLLFSLAFCIYYKIEAFRTFRIRMAVLSGLLLLWAAYCLINLNVLMNGLRGIANDMIIKINSVYATRIALLETGSGGKLTFMLAIAFFIVWISASAIVDKRDNLGLMAVMFPFSVISLISGQADIRFAALLGFIFFAATVNAGVRRRRAFWKRAGESAYARNVDNDSRLRFKLILFCVPVTLIAMLISMRIFFPVLDKPLEYLSDKTYKIRVEGIRFIAEYIPKATGENITLSVDGIGGGISGGILGELEGTFYTLQESIKVTCDHLPKDTVYLKGYVGSVYTGSRWLAREKETYEYMAEHWKTEGEPWHYIYNLAFLRTAYALRKLNTDGSYGNLEPSHITIENMNENIAFTYVPYNAYLNDFYELNGGDCYVSGQTRYDNSFAWYEEADVRKLLEDYHDSIEMDDSYSPLDEIETSYRFFITNADALQSDASAVIRDLCAAKREEWEKKITDNMTAKQKYDLEREKIDDVTNFIRKTLWENCDFEDKAVKLPKGKDYVDYFLTEIKTGDSTAFASAAVLMFRQMGIPARYVEGYVVPVNIFSESSGEYFAVLQDDNAHAWAEVYMPFEGWRQVEMTPGFDGNITEVELDEKDKDKKDEKDEEEKTEENEDEKSFLLYRRPVIISMAVTALALAFFIRLLILKCRRKGIFLRSDHDRIVRIFSGFYEMLVFDGFKREADVTSVEFTEDLTAGYECFTGEETGRFMDVVLRTFYGPGEPENDDVEYALLMYDRLSGYLYGRQNIMGKLKFKLWKAF